MPLSRACTCFTAALLLTTPGFAQSSPEPVDAPTQLPSLLWNDGIGTVSAPWRMDEQDWTRLALGATAVVGTALLLDRPIHKALQQGLTPSLTRWSNDIAPLGNPGSFLIGGGLYAMGLVTGDAEVRATGADTLCSLAVTAVTLIPMKIAAGRARPDENLGPRSFQPGGSRDSFPSGHTAFAFAAAAAITEHYSDTWVQVSAYGAASLIGLSRLEQNQHWASDVLAGGLIGTTLGKLVTRMNQKQRYAKQGRVRFFAEPALGLGYQGVRLGMVF